MKTALIKNGLVFDGSGKAGEEKDIFIKGEKIAGIGDFKGKGADLIIDAEGSFVSPGFVDIDNDSDHQLTFFSDSGQESLLCQGITSVLGGNCGSSLAPISAGDLRSIRKWSDINLINVDWGTVDEFLLRLENMKIGVNFGTLVGHSTVRRSIIGEQLRDLTDEEMGQMIFLIQRGMADGAFGVSAGLEYSHSQSVPLAEVAKIAGVAKSFNGLFALHLRSQKEGLFAAVAEIEDLAEALKNGGVPRIEISHLKSFAGFEEELSLSLAMLARLAGKGLNVNFDVYPYDASGAVLYSYLPAWASRGGFDRLVAHLKNPAVFKRIADELAGRRLDYSKIFISEAANLPFAAGESLAKAAAKKGSARPEEVLLEILLLAGGRAMALEETLSWNGTKNLLTNDLSFVATNDAGRNYGRNPAYWPHPRVFGSLPKFLGLVRDEKLVSWEKAIFKITGGPAKKIGLKDRGFIKDGYFADIAIFNPEKINSKASLKNPYLAPEGMEFVFLNGRLAVKEGRSTGLLAGRVLRRE